MKIGTINIDWFKKSKSTKDLIIEKIKQQNFDFLIVTENILSFLKDERYFVYHTLAIPTDKQFQHLDYGKFLKGELPIRTTIYSKYKATELLQVADPYTSVSIKFLVEGKEIIIYASIIGTWGIMHQNDIAKVELENFKNDLQNILLTNENVFIVGDFNTSFIKSENREMATICSREELIKFTNENFVIRITEDISDNIDHIFVSQSLAMNIKNQPSVFIESNLLKDEPHKGICFDISI